MSYTSLVILAGVKRLSWIVYNDKFDRILKHVIQYFCINYNIPDKHLVLEVFRENFNSQKFAHH